MPPASTPSEHSEPEHSGLSTEASRGAHFAQLLVRHDRALRRYVLAMIPRKGDADEVMQRTAVRLWTKFDEFDTQREFLPWAIQQTYFEILNFRKEFARRKLFFREEVMQRLADCRPEYDSLQEQRRTALEKCLKRINREGVQLLRRRYCDSGSIADLAIELGQTAKALYRRLDRLRASIAECIRSRMGEVQHEHE